MEEDRVGRFKNRLLRTKTIKSESSLDIGEGTPLLQKCLTTLDLISLGVGSCCGTGMYVVAGLVARNVAGPGVIFSFIIAAIASIMSGVCYGEFGVRVPKTSGSAYMYSYVTVGEFVAFLIGWNLILEYIIGSAAGASAISSVIDSLSNYTISDHLKAEVGTVIGKAYPDFIGLVIGLIMTAVIAVGVQKSVRFNNVLNLINLIVWVFIFVTGFCLVRGNLWATEHGFLPYGMSGVFSGAATCFYAFIGFDIIATTGEEARNPSRSIPRAIVSSLVICLIAYISVSIIMTLLVPYYDIHERSPLIDVFGQRDAVWAKFIVAIGAVSALTVSLLGSMFPAPRVVYAISRDGLLFEFLSRIHPATGTPLIATIITGTLASLMSLLVGLQELVEMMSIGTLLAYTLVSISVLILRYQHDPRDLEPAVPMAHKLEPIEEQSSGDNTPSDDNTAGKVKRTFKVKDDAYLLSPDGLAQNYSSLPLGGGRLGTAVAWVHRHGKILWLRLGMPSDDAIPTEKSSKTVIILVGVLLVLQTGACLLIVFGERQLGAGEWWAVILLLIFVSAILVSVFLVLRQPQSKRKLDFMAPAVPYLPCSAMFINIYLMLKLPSLTWMRLGVWLGIGLLLYFSYGMWNSVKEKRQRQSKTEEPKGPQDETPSYQQTTIEDEVFEKAETPPGGPTINHSNHVNHTQAHNDPWRPANQQQPVNKGPTRDPVRASNAIQPAKKEPLQPNSHPQYNSKDTWRQTTNSQPATNDPWRAKQQPAKNDPWAPR